MLQKVFLVGAVVAGFFGMSNLTAACTIMTLNDVAGSLATEDQLEEFGVSYYDTEDVADGIAEARNEVSVSGRVAVGVILMLLSAAFLLMARSPNLDARWQRLLQATQTQSSA